jgi:hypothetical protein
LVIQTSPFSATVLARLIVIYRSTNRGSIKSQGRRNGKQGSYVAEIHALLTGTKVAAKYRPYLGRSQILKTKEIAATAATPPSQSTANHNSRRDSGCCFGSEGFNDSRFRI